MYVCYSIAAKLGSGIGYTAEQAIKYIKKEGYLKNLITLEDIPIATDIPRVKDDTFDALASTKIRPPVDIFHGWGNMCYAQLLAASRFGAKTIVERASSHILTQNRILMEEHRRFGYDSVPIHPWVIKKSLAEFKETDYVTVPSRFAYDSFLEEGYPEQKLILNPFGVDTERFHPMNVERDDQFRVAFFGENWIRKGLHYLLKAWNELDLKNAKLFIRSSNPPFFNDIDYKSIEHIGWVEDLTKFYNTLDVFCLPTLEEGNALVIGELAACGIPSITTPNAGTWLDDKSCFFMPIRDIAALKQRLHYCYDNRNELKNIGKKARKIAEKNTWDDYGKRLIENYRRISN